MLERAVVQFHEQAQATAANALEAHRRTKSEVPKLKASLRKLEIEARNLSSAIAKYGTHKSPILLTQFSLVENRIDTITHELQAPELVIPDVPIERIREFVLEKAKDLEEVVQGILQQRSRHSAHT